MSIHEFINKLNLILSFAAKMDRENIPQNFQHVIIKIYANTLRLNLTDKMISDIYNFHTAC